MSWLRLRRSTRTELPISLRLHARSFRFHPIMSVNQGAMVSHIGLTWQRPGSARPWPGILLPVAGNWSSVHFHLIAKPIRLPSRCRSSRLALSTTPVTVQGWYLYHWLDFTPLADCVAVIRSVLGPNGQRLPATASGRPLSAATDQRGTTSSRMHRP